MKQTKNPHIVVAAGLILATIAYAALSTWAALVIGAATLLLLSVELWPILPAIILIVSGNLNTFFLYVPLFGLNVKPEQWATAGILVLALVRQRLAGTIAITVTGAFLLVWVATTAISSLLGADLQRGLILSIQILLAVIPFFVFVNLLRTHRHFISATRVLLIVGIFEAAFGLTAWVVGHFSEGALWTFRYVDGYVNTRGTFMEMNIFADFVVATTGILIPIVIVRRRPMALLTLAMCLAAVVVSKTRGAWIAQALILLLSPLVVMTAGLLRPRAVFARSVTMIALLFVLVLPASMVLAVTTETSDALTDRIATLAELRGDPTFAGRLAVNSTALAVYWERSTILLGRGAKGFNSDGYDVLGIGDDWIGNIFMGALYDSGLIGFVAFGFALFIPLRRGVSVLRSSADAELKLAVAGLLLACVSLVASGQSNNHSWMALLWMYFGIMSAANPYGVLKGVKQNLASGWRPGLPRAVSLAPNSARQAEV